MNNLKNISALGKGIKSLFPNGDSQPKARKYWEVFGDALQSVQFLKRVSMSLAFAVILLLVLLYKQMNTPPIVIRVNEVGLAEPIRDINYNHQVTKPEVLNFVQLYMKYFLERNHYTWKDNFILAGNMMTQDYLERINSEFNYDEEVNSIIENKLTSKLELSNIKVARETSDHIIVQLNGWRLISSYDNPDFKKEVIFETEVGIKKVKRSISKPYGLLVDSYLQKDLKNE